MERLGHEVSWLDREQIQSEVSSPTYTSGLWDRNGCALVDPARLVWGLKATAERLGVRIYEDTKATDLERDGIGVMVTTPLGHIRAGKVALAMKGRFFLRQTGNPGKYIVINIYWRMFYKF